MCFFGWLADGPSSLVSKSGVLFHQTLQRASARLSTDVLQYGPSALVAAFGRLGLIVAPFATPVCVRAQPRPRPQVWQSNNGFAYLESE